jgi:two-component system cell cycle sensor histidine kinase/response regulator CckA
VLVVEDEPALLRLAVQALSHFGYRVLSAEDGESALRVEAAHMGPIDLVISDIVMPRMGTKELVAALAKRRVGFKVLYISGYSADVIVHQGLAEEGAQFLAKPFSLAALGSKVREVLDAP